MRYRLVTAFFPGRAEAEGALERLTSLGVARHEISWIPKHVQRPDDLAVKVASKAAEGAALGGVVGGVVGALFGALGAGGALVVPGVGEVLAGPLVAALAFAGAIGAIGTAIGAAFGARVPEFEAVYLPDALSLGGSLLGVRCSVDRASAVEGLLEGAGARLVRHFRVR